ncbi:hypothetical protein [Shinella sp.]|uniref:hypothetical protein n=1 Tax=Shinella sp. TaxID=1870904 RepID=UPI0040372916
MLDMPHTMDLSRMKVLDQVLKTAIADAQRLSREHLDLSRKKENLQHVLRNVQDRQRPLGFGDGVSTPAGGGRTPEMTTQQREEERALSVELREVEQSLADNLAAQSKAQEVGTAANGLYHRCKNFIAEVLE